MALTANQLIAKLNGDIESTLAKLIPAGPLALVDYPNHSNVGDSAIWLGEAEYLKRRPDAKLVYCCDLADYRREDLQQVIGSGTILIHGGGNFGTIWRKHQNFRIEIMERFPNNPIVQMPQSIHFQGEELLPETARAIAKHGNFTLLVRDKPSYDFAKAKFDCAVQLCPDMAFCIGSRPRLTADVDLLYLLRTDGEKLAGMDPVDSAESRVAVDWLGDDRRRIRSVKLKHRLLSYLPGDKFARRKSLFDDLGWSRFWRGRAVLSRGKVVVTDRLHAHIISLLLGIPHVALDNNYGKLSNFIGAWTSELDNLRTATDMRGALEQARVLLKG
jgi:pyruvyl transferase EpsO